MLGASVGFGFVAAGELVGCNSEVALDVKTSVAVLPVPPGLRSGSVEDFGLCLTGLELRGALAITTAALVVGCDCKNLRVTSDVFRVDSRSFRPVWVHKEGLESFGAASDFFGLGSDRFWLDLAPIEDFGFWGC